MRAVAPILVLLALPAFACSRESAPIKPDSHDASPPALSASVRLTAGDPPPAPPAAPIVDAAAADASGPYAPSSKSYKVVLQTGDSMVGGGLCRALQPRFAAEGTKFVRDVWESGSIENFADNDRLKDLIKRHDPDLVLLTMGANDVGGNITDYLAKKIERVAATTQRGHARDCIWIGPPKWRINGKPVVDMIRAHAAPCTFFDSTDIEMHRKEDKIHPDERGGEEWAVVFWRFFRGEGAPATFLDGGPFSLPK